MSNTHGVTKVYKLGSSPLVHAPGILAWAINGFAFEDDREAILGIMMATWKGIPKDVMAGVLSKRITYKVDGTTVLIEG